MGKKGKHGGSSSSSSSSDNGQGRMKDKKCPKAVEEAPELASADRALVRKTSLYASLVDAQEAKRFERMALAASESGVPPWAAEYIRRAAPAIGAVCASVEVIVPKAVKAGTEVYATIQRLPQDVLATLYGLGICYYGGRYAVTISAAEAFNATGGKQAATCFLELRDQLQIVWRAHVEDDARDADEDGVPDVDEIDKKELGRRKIALLLRTIDPEVVQRALGGAWAGYMSVLAVLRFKFAQTVALAHSIGDNLRPIAGKVLGPALVKAMPQEYRRWVNPLINLACKLFAMMIAWRIQLGISTVQSGVQGGLIASRALLALLRRKKILNMQDEDTYFDEVAGYSLAASGIYFQLIKGGSMPFPLRQCFWPMDLLEWWLKWSVTWMARPTSSGPGAAAAVKG